MEPKKSGLLIILEAKRKWPVESRPSFRRTFQYNMIQLFELNYIVDGKIIENVNILNITPLITFDSNGFLNRMEHRKRQKFAEM